MFTDILFAAGGSACALRAAAAATLAKKLTARVTLIRVSQSLPVIGPYGGIINAGPDKTSRTRSTR